MSLLDLVRKRRSCRNYSAQAVGRGALERCLEAARLAPSACNSQPWHFIVVEDGDLRKELAGKAFSGIYGMNAFARQAPVLVAVIRENSTYAAMLGAAFRSTQYSLIDLGIACEHFILQAEEEGLGACWLGWFNEKAVKKTLKIPFHKKVDIMISIGYPAEPLPFKKNRKEIFRVSEFR